MHAPTMKKAPMASEAPNCSPTRTALIAAAKSGSVVLVGMPASGVMSEIDPGTMAAYSQNILGSKMGSARIQVDIPNLVDLYGQGRVKLDELVTKTYPIEEINEAIDAVKRGEALRNVIVF